MPVFYIIVILIILVLYMMSKETWMPYPSWIPSIRSDPKFDENTLK